MFEERAVEKKFAFCAQYTFSASLMIFKAFKHNRIVTHSVHSLNCSLCIYSSILKIVGSAILIQHSFVCYLPSDWI
jgi:hypothetical protein